MKQAIILTVSCVMCVAGSLDAATLNFEVDANGNPISAPVDPPYYSLSNEYVDWGIVFESTTEVNSRASTGDLNTPPNALVADHHIDNITLDAHFVDPNNPSIDGTVTWVEFFQDRGAVSGGGAFTAYDIDGNVVVNAEPFNSGGGTFRWDYAGGIHRIFIGACNDGLDDLTFGPVTPVPEPATMGLLALGGLALIRRRKKRV